MTSLAMTRFPTAPLDAHEMEGHRAALFGLCYRMLGTGADAEDVVQDTFARAIERPPVDTASPLRPWLVRVATNLCIDALRRRRRRGYHGPWLPTPVDTRRLLVDLSPGDLSPVDLSPAADARYELAEAATSAFLVALEALEPRPRAVLVLRDVFGLSGPEVAEILELSAGNVRVILHRARGQLEAFDQSRVSPSAEVRERCAKLLRELIMRMGLRDFEGVARMLSDDVTSVTDGGGEVHASVRVNRGRQDVLRLYANLVAAQPWPTRLEEREFNGLPALVMEYPEHGEKHATSMVLWLELDEAGLVRGLRTVLAPSKLTRVGRDR